MREQISLAKDLAIIAGVLGIVIVTTTISVIKENIAEYLRTSSY